MANADTGNGGGLQGISGDGTAVFFSSAATNLDRAATDGQLHAFLRTQGSMKHFAVLGDSYSSGEGVPPFVPPSGDDRCDRSYSAYAEDLTAVMSNMALTGFAACSGATSHQIITGMKAENSQLQSISKIDDLIVLTAGGDDIGFDQFVTACVFGRCAKGTKAFNKAEDAIRNRIPPNLAVLFSHLKAAVSSGARILVLGYPEVLPPLGAPYRCSKVRARDQTAAQKAEGDLNAAVVAAVKKADASTARLSFEYVSPFTQFAGHELCSPHSIKAYLTKHPKRA